MALIFITISAVWIVSLYYVVKSFREKKEYSHDQNDLPNSFLELSSNERKKALDYAWNGFLLSSSNFSSRVKSTGNKAFNSLFMGFVIFINGLGLITTLVGLNSSIEDEPISGLAFISGLFYGIGIFLVYALETKKQNDELKASKGELINARKKNLGSIGTEFVLRNQRDWIIQLEKLSTNQAQIISDSDYEASFLLYSADYSKTGLESPIESLDVTHIFSNGFLSVVSDISFEIKATSYSLVDSDQVSLQTNSSDEWATDEFHYQDVIECNFEPTKVDSGSVKSSDEKHRIDGYLTLSLVNGSKKQYPTTKSGVSNFLRVARNKIRSFKKVQ